MKYAFNPIIVFLYPFRLAFQSRGSGASRFHIKRDNKSVAKSDQVSTLLKILLLCDDGNNVIVSFE